MMQRYHIYTTDCFTIARLPRVRLRQNALWIERNLVRVAASEVLARPLTQKDDIGESIRHWRRSAYGRRDQEKRHLGRFNGTGG
jgi:hypothetical protein